MLYPLLKQGGISTSHYMAIIIATYSNRTITVGRC